MSYDFEKLWSARLPRIYCDPASVNAEAIICEMPVELVDSASEADLLWVRKDYREWYSELRPSQALNHIPLEESIVHKGNLAHHLQRYGRAHPQDTFSHRDFLQPTYRLYDPQERMEFLQQLPAVDRPDNLWILKPTNLSRGIGIKIVWQFDWLRKALRKSGDIAFRNEGQTLDYVIQRYIKDVLLLDSRKSEIRIYWLIASLDPLLVLMYQEGTARLTTEPYKLDDFNNRLIHVTNTYQQKKYGSGEVDAVLKWDFAGLESYLVREKSAPKNFLEKVLKPRLKQCLAYVVQASIEELKQTPPSGFFFGLYGADLILDDKLTPWLTEVQKSPGLSHDDEVKQRVMPSMLRGAVSIMLETLALRRTGKPLTELSQTYGYEWVLRVSER